jgi:hypothetical protein
MHLVQLYNLDDGRSSIRTVSLKAAPMGGSGREDTLPIAVEPVFFRESVGSHADDHDDQSWHRPSRRQLIVVLSGGFDIEAEDGSTAHIGPGEILLAEDSMGRGHLTRTWRGARLYLPLPDEVDLSDLLTEIPPHVESLLTREADAGHSQNR